jgi:hypothetical protein
MAGIDMHNHMQAAGAVQAPLLVQPISKIRVHPVRQKRRGCCQMHILSRTAHQRQRGQPGFEVSGAGFAPERAADLLPDPLVLIGLINTMDLPRGAHLARKDPAQ